jgi:hypothetical protein
MDVLAALSLDGLVQWGIEAGLAAVASTVVSVFILRARVATLEQALTKAVDAAEANAKALAAIQLGQLQCQASCAREYATRGETGRIIADQTVMWQRVMDRLDQYATEQRTEMTALHNRVTDLATGLSGLSGRLERTGESA